MNQPIGLLAKLSARLYVAHPQYQISFKFTLSAKWSTQGRVYESSDWHDERFGQDRDSEKAKKSLKNHLYGLNMKRQGVEEGLKKAGVSS